MKKGFSTIMVSAVLVVIILIAASWILFEQKGKTGSMIDNLWKLFFPEKTEQITIPGTVVGGGCAPVLVKSTAELAQVIIDCCNKGKCRDTVSDAVPCCNDVGMDPTGSGTITKSDLIKAVLARPDGKSITVNWHINEVIPIKKNIPAFRICYTAPWAGGNEVHVTFNENDCTTWT